MQRREFVQFLTAAGAFALLPIANARASSRGFVPLRQGRPAFTPVRVPIPLSRRSPELKRYEVKDALTLPTQYTYDVVCAWGDRVFPDQSDRFGYNNDFTAFFPLNKDGSEALLWVNHEYVSAKVWIDTYETVVGKPLPGREKLVQGGNLSVDEQRSLAREALYDQGGSILHVHRDPSGHYQVVSKSPYNRRISGIAGLDRPAELLDSDGPAVAVFASGKDGLGRRVVGTFANCSGGVTPWGTVLSCEENFQNQVGDGVDSSGQPLVTNASLTADNFPSNAALLLGLQANKYGWVVEVDPHSDSRGIKHTALGRFRHENVGLRAVEGKPLACYMGDDRTGGHTYKYVSRQPYRATDGKRNSALLADGTLYVAHYSPDGTGIWIPLLLTTPVNPADPERAAGGRVLVPNRPAGGASPIDTAIQAAEFKQKFATLGDLYTSQGALLVDAFLASNAVGGTPTARPEDLEVHPLDGSVFIAYTSGARSAEGGPDERIFVTATKTEDKRDKPPHGAIYRIVEAGNEPGAMRFRWSAFVCSGEVATGGVGFAYPDNLCFDPAANLWVCTDIGNQNQPVPNRSLAADSATSGLFGSNTLWFIAMAGSKPGVVLPFATGPNECEMTGPTFTADGSTLFLSVQHPGEDGGWRRNHAFRPETQYDLLSADGKRTFVQTRLIPVGSNFPSQNGGPPRPCVVAIRRA